MKFLLKTYTLLLLLAISLQAEGQRLELDKLSGQINTMYYDEISPVVSRDGRTIFFTRVGYPIFNKTIWEKGRDVSENLSDVRYELLLKKIFGMLSGKPVRNPVYSGFNQDIWIGRSRYGEFDEIIHPGYPLNNALPNSVCAITPNPDKVIVINQFPEEGGMQKGFSYSEKTDTGWTFPQPVEINDYSNNHPDVSLTMSSDGKVMILSFQRSDGLGDNDLYVCFRVDENLWSAPRHISSGVNSAYREITPFLSDDNKTLYFSSNRPGSMGGNDIFLARRTDDTWLNWTRPRAFIPPINSRSDDSQPYFNSSSGYLYFTSKRDGSSDIFRVRIAPPVPETVTVRGRVLDDKTGKLSNASIFTSTVGSEESKEVYLSDDGYFEIEINKGDPVEIKAEKSGYFAGRDTVHFKREYAYFKDYNVTLKVRPIEAGATIALDDIFFVRSESEILEKSFPALDKLAFFLQENGTVYIRIEGHTDNQGDKDALQKLSEDRAGAVKEYLVYQKRISPLRIETVGFGDSYPVNNNSTEELRRKNRRVEVKVIKVNKIFGESGTR